MARYILIVSTTLILSSFLSSTGAHPVENIENLDSPQVITKIDTLENVLESAVDEDISETAADYGNPENETKVVFLIPQDIVETHNDDLATAEAVIFRPLFVYRKYYAKRKRVPRF